MPLAKGLSPCRPSLLFTFAGQSPWDSDSHASAPEIVSQLTWDEAQKSPPPRPQQPRGRWEQTCCRADGLLVPWGLPLLAFRGSMLSGVFTYMVWTFSGSLDGAFLFCHPSLYLGVLQGLTSQTLLFTYDVTLFQARAEPLDQEWNLCLLTPLTSAYSLLLSSSTIYPCLFTIYDINFLKILTGISQYTEIEKSIMNPIFDLQFQILATSYHPVSKVSNLISSILSHFLPEVF